jgi:uncharacterized protein (TIGR02246 family)
MTSQSDVRAAVEAGGRDFSAAIARGDAAAVAAVYTSAAQVFPPNQDIVTGRAAIQQFYQGLIRAGVKGVPLTTREVEAQGDTAYEVGTYRVTGDGNKVLDSGKYVVVWKREDGKWKMHRDIWNSNLPPPKPQ